MKLFSLPKNKRLVSNSQFRAVLASRLRADDELLRLYIADNNCGYPRLGISVEKTCGTAVVRNRLKRLLRETFRQNQHEIPQGFDYLLMISHQWTKKNGCSADAAKAVKKLSFDDVKTSFLALVDKAVRELDKK